MPGAGEQQTQGPSKGPQWASTVQESTERPIERKTAMTGVGGALSLVLIWIAKQAGVELDEFTAVAMATLIIFGVSYRTSPGKEH
jgi:hypothetical protein